MLKLKEGWIETSAGFEVANGRAWCKPSEDETDGTDDFIRDYGHGAFYAFPHGLDDFQECATLEEAHEYLISQGSESPFEESV